MNQYHCLICESLYVSKLPQKPSESSLSRGILHALISPKIYFLSGLVLKKAHTIVAHL
jgi:hypothetical protein